MVDDYQSKKELPHYMTVDEIMKGAVPCTILEDVQREIEIGTLKGIYSRDYLIKLGYNPEEIDSIESIEPDNRAAQDWSELCDLIVGQEYKGPQRFF